jgi:hypothetical protein
VYKGCVESTFFEGFEPQRVRSRPKDSQDVVDFVNNRLGFEPDERQMEVLRSTAKRGILNCRQWGKSTVAAAKAVHRAYTKAGCVVLVASPSKRQSGETVLKAEEFLDRLGIAPKGDGVNEISLMLPNGSRIVGLPGVEGRVRGISAVSLMLFDEAAQMEDRTYKSLRPMLAVSRGDLWMMSTPYGKRGFFYQRWEHGGPEWMRMRVRATECARIDAAFLEEERGEQGAAWFAQEYMGEFVDNGSEVFGRQQVEDALDDDGEVLWPVSARKAA